ncbi:MAG: UMP kinase [Longimicrobiaceae bacterium]
MSAAPDPDRAAVPPKYDRVLIKLSGEMLAGERGFGIDSTALDHLTGEIGAVRGLGVEVGVVIGGGNIVRGTAASEQGIDRVSADYMGMLSTVINALALQDTLERSGVQTRVMTALRVEQVAEPYIRRRAIRHMEKGRVVVLAGGTGNPYFSTDSGAVLRGIEIGAQIIIKATKVDGVYSADPALDQSAEFIPRVSFFEVLTRELKVMDAAAISLCRENCIPIIVLNLQIPGSITRAIRGEEIGTFVHP